MPAPFRLSVLDQSPIPEGCSIGDALRNSIDLASAAEAFGYHRYWVAEHHGAPGLACTSPEALIGPIALATSHIRVGSGGVMLPHYSPLKVAETFRMLAGLAPGRIDLGIGRAAGTSQRVALMLQRDRRQPPPDDFKEQLEELLRYFPPSAGNDAPAPGAFPQISATHGTPGRGPVAAGHPVGGHSAAGHSAAADSANQSNAPSVQRSSVPVSFRTGPHSVNPVAAEAPDVWLLGSSPQSAIWAAELGLPYVFADFINPAGSEYTAAYQRFFHPSDRLAAPRTAIALWAICADTDEQAMELSFSWRMMMTMLFRGRPIPVPTIDRARRFLAEEGFPPETIPAGRRAITGTPAKVRASIEAVAAQYGAEEVLIVNILHDHAARRRSYELIAEAFELGSDSRLPDEPQLAALHPSEPRP